MFITCEILLCSSKVYLSGFGVANRLQENDHQMLSDFYCQNNTLADVHIYEYIGVFTMLFFGAMR